jgi:hypothetical protein
MNELADRVHLAVDYGSSALPAFGIVIGVTAVIGLAFYVWYALALSKVFTRLGVEGWKAWVPFLNEATILTLGGKPWWNVFFYVIPVVQIYGLILKIQATHAINGRYGRGAGSTALAVLLPPVWASILAWGVAPYPEGDRLAALQPGPRRQPQPGADAAHQGATQGYLAPPILPHGGQSTTGAAGGFAPGAPTSEAPAYGAPAYGAPAYGTPTPGAPTFGAPAPGAPAYGAAPAAPDAFAPTFAPEGAEPAPSAPAWLGLSGNDVPAPADDPHTATIIVPPAAQGAAGVLPQPPAPFVPAPPVNSDPSAATGMPSALQPTDLFGAPAPSAAPQQTDLFAAPAPTVPAPIAPVPTASVQPGQFADPASSFPPAAPQPEGFVAPPAWPGSPAPAAPPGPMIVDVPGAARAEAFEPAAPVAPVSPVSSVQPCPPAPPPARAADPAPSFPAAPGGDASSAQDTGFDPAIETIRQAPARSPFPAEPQPFPFGQAPQAPAQPYVAEQPAPIAEQPYVAEPYAPIAEQPYVAEQPFPAAPSSGFVDAPAAPDVFLSGGAGAGVPVEESAPSVAPFAQAPAPSAAAPAPITAPVEQVPLAPVTAPVEVPVAPITAPVEQVPLAPAAEPGPIWPAPVAPAPVVAPAVADAPISEAQVDPFAPPQLRGAGLGTRSERAAAIRPAPIPVTLPVEPTPIADALIDPAPAAPIDFGRLGAEPEPDLDAGDDDFEATVVVPRRRGVRRVLVLDDGRSFALSATSIVIGRNPEGDPGEQRLAISDRTRTLSKTHARLIVQGDEWRLMDLHSTNGVVVVADDGAETLLDPGEAVIGGGRFILGEVGMHVEVETDS